MVQNVLLLLYPVISDWKSGEYNLIPEWLIAALILVFNLFMGQIDFYSVITGVIPGVILEIISVITKGKIGNGDAWMTGMLGMNNGFIKTCQILFIAMVSVCLWSLILLVFRKVHRQTRIPFIPFLLLAVLIQEVIRL